MNLIDWSGGWRLQREKRDSRDPGLSAAKEAARPRPRKASTRSANPANSIFTEFVYKIRSKLNGVFLFKNSVHISKQIGNPKNVEN
jgi:hypothetical protein